MSIYASTLIFDPDGEHTSACARMKPLGPDEPMQAAADGETPIGVLNDDGAFQLVDGECTCGGSKRAPIRYRGSHVIPDGNDRGGSFDLGTIPPHIRRDYSKDEEGPDIQWPFLRVGFEDPFGGDYPRAGKPPSHGTIVLDADQVRELRDHLTAWLERGTDW